MEYNVERAKAAMNYLVRSQYYAQTWRKVVAAAQRGRSEPFTGEQETLNELVVIGRQNMQALENLYEVVKSKRHDKNDYQRQFMAAKRRRDGKAVKLQEAVGGARMTYEERREFLLSKYAEWHKARDKMLAQTPELEWDDRNAKIRDFWDAVERDLDVALRDFA
jgi:hypothetical protein